MLKPSRKRSPAEANIDWYVISVQKLRQWGVIAVVVIAAGVWGFFAWKRSHESIDIRAQRKITEAADELARARQIPDAPRYASQIREASDYLEEARALYAKRQFQDAWNRALESELKSDRLLGRGGERQVGDAMLSHAEGDVAIQRTGSGSWESVHDGQALFNGDFVRTGHSGAAEILFTDGTLYTLRPDSLFEVHGAAASRRSPSSEVKMVTGDISVYTAQSGSTIKTDAATAEIQQETRAGITVEEDKSTDVSVTRGAATVRTDHGTAQLADRQKTRADFSTRALGPTVDIPPYPTPVNPIDGKLFDLRTEQDVTLSWTKVSEAVRYRLQISRSRLFIPDAMIVDLDNRTANRQTVKVLEEGTFYWRVAAINGGGQSSDWSPSLRFRMSSNPSAEAVQVQAPDLVLQAPQQMGNLFLIFGKASPGAAVTVNGEPVDVDADGSFKKAISVTREGYSEIVVKAAASGQETVRTQRVFVDAY
jgi:FecR protein/Glucodextranase, domain B